MPGPDNFNSGFLWGKKDVQTDYVSITPEQQAEIDKANANAEAARNSEALQQGLSNKQPDLDKGVVCERSNLPLLTEEQVLANQGEIRQADPWIVRTFNNGEYHVKNFLKELGISIVGGALLVGKGALMSLGVILSCSKEEPMSPPDAGASVTFLRKDAADYVVNYLNTHDTIVNVQTGEEIPICKETDDGVKFTYGYDYDAKTDAVSPYIDFGNGLKLPIFMDPLSDLTDGNIIDYINIIGDELATSDGVNYDFKLEDDKAQVEFDNGLTHNIGDDITLNPDGTTAKLSAMLASVNLAQPEQNSTKIALELETGEGSYGNGTPGFAMNIVTPARLKDITSGNPTVKGNVGGYDFEGQTKQAQSGTLQLEVNGKIISNAQDGIIIKNANGDEVYMQAEKGFDLQSQWDEPGQDYNLFDGVVVYVKEAGSDVFKEKFIMSKFDDAHTDIGIIDRENGAIVQNYPSTMTAFDTYGAIEAEDYYNDKEDNLNDAYTTADSNFRYLNQFEAQANADVDIY